MSGLLSTLVIVGLAIVFLFKRCVIIPELCTPPAAAAAAPAPVDQAAIDAAIAAGIAAGTAVDPTTGLTKDQLKAQDEHLKNRSPEDAKAIREDIQRRQTKEDDVQSSRVSLCASDRCKKNPKDFICVQAGCHNSVIKDLTKNVQKTSTPPKTSCKSNEIMVCKNAAAGAKTIQCSCSKANNFTGYSRLISNYTNRNYIPYMSTSSRFTRVSI